MFHFSPARGLAALPVFWVLSAVAQAPASLPSSSPFFPSSSVPEAATLPFHSAFDGYQPFSDEKPIPWPEANATVARRGGWRAYAQAAADADAQERPAAPEGAGPHAGHPMTMPMPPKERP